MAQDRNLSVTEARLGLSLLTCLLVALGYVLLQRIGGTGTAPPIEIRPSQTAQQDQPGDGRSSDAPVAGRDLPQVLVAEGADTTSAERQPHTSRRPEWNGADDADGTVAPSLAPLR